MTDLDAFFMQRARDVAAGSPDRSTKVGCVIVGPDGLERAAGFNAMPRGVRDDINERHQRPAKYAWTEHAERNAIYAAARAGVPLDGCRVYLPWFPCCDCARALIQVGAVELVCHEPDLSDPKWGEDFRRSLEMFTEAGMAVRFVVTQEGTDD